MSSSELRARAREQLGGGIFTKPWLMALVACLIVTVINGVAGSVIPYVGSLVVVGPMSYGLAYVFLENTRNQKPVEFGDLFKAFDSGYLEHLLLGLMIYIFTFLWSLLFVVPGIIKSYSYAMAYYIKVDNPTWGWKECIDESIKMMDGHKMDLFVLDLTFIGWIILGSLVCGIGVLWVLPYMYVAHTHFYEEIR